LAVLDEEDHARSVAIQLALHEADVLAQNRIQAAFARAFPG
jgi:hypothetical protein